MTYVVNTLGIVLIILTYWFFFMKKEDDAVDAGDEITIKVEGGYKPNVIKVKKNESTTLKFHRLDESSCLEDVVIPDLNIREHLPLNKVVDITINPSKAGEFTISCGMNMFHGKIIVGE